MNKQRELDIKALNNLNNGECYIIPEGDYGKAEIWCINNTFFVFGIPTFGGEPTYDEHIFVGSDTHPEQKQKAINKVINLVYSWS